MGPRLRHGGRASVRAHAFEVLGRSEIVSFTDRRNARSRAVMERLGMQPLAEYGHPVEGRAPVPWVCYLLGRPASAADA